MDEIPFDSERKKMTIVRKTHDDRLMAFVKGAPDVLLNDCAAIEENGESRAITITDRNRILEINNSLANQAMRVLAVAHRVLGKALDTYVGNAIERDLIFIGLIVYSHVTICIFKDFCTLL